jgi:hypothetical protein
MLYTSQRMEVYMLIVYFIHRKCVNITLSHHLQLKLQCNFTYTIKGFFSCKIDCNFFLVTNCSHKLTFFYSYIYRYFEFKYCLFKFIWKLCVELQRLIILRLCDHSWNVDSLKCMSIIRMLMSWIFNLLHVYI